MLATIVAVVGTILGAIVGAVLGFVFQRKNAVDVARLSRAESLRQERSAAYAEFAGALGVYRRAQIERWHAATAESPSATAARTLAEARKQRDVAREVMFRIQLIAATENVREGAREAFDAMSVHIASSDDVAAARDTTWSAMYRFVDLAREELDQALRGTDLSRDRVR